MMDTKSNLKIEDLGIKKELNYKENNKVFKLQVTDDKNKVTFERKFLDKNEDSREYKNE